MAFFISVVSSPGVGTPPGTRVAVGATGCTLGRNPDNDLALPDPERVISGHHARLEVRDGALWLTDQSTNGTFLNHGSDRLPPQQPVQLAPGDCIGIGPYELSVGDDPAGAPAGAEVAANPFANPFATGAADLPGLSPASANADILDLLGAPNDDASLLGVGPLDQQPRAPATPSHGGHHDPFQHDGIALDDLLGGPASPAPPGAAPAPPTPLEHIHVAPPVLGAPFAATPDQGALPEVPPTTSPVASPVAATTGPAAAPTPPPDYDLLADAFGGPEGPTPASTSGSEPNRLDPFAAQPLATEHEQPRPADPTSQPVPDPSRDPIPDPIRDQAPAQAPGPDPVPTPAPPPTEAVAPPVAAPAGATDFGADLDWSHWGESIIPANPTAPASVTDPSSGPDSGASPSPDHAAPAPPPPATATATPTPAPTAAPTPLPANPPPAAASPAPTAVTATDQALLQAFLAGLGIDPATPITDPAALLQASGALLRELTAGLTTTLQARAVFKNELRLGMTVMRARENNAFKFSATVEEAIERLLLHPRPGYLPALQAAREAHEDIQAHEMAMLAGLQAALRSLLARFEPATLEQRLGARSGLDKLLPMARRSRYWELFTETYTQVAADATEDFMELFGDAFTRAYEDQIQRLKQARRQAEDGSPTPPSPGRP